MLLELAKCPSIDSCLANCSRLVFLYYTLHQILRTHQYHHIGRSAHFSHSQPSNLCKQPNDESHILMVFLRRIKANLITYWSVAVVVASVVVVVVLSVEVMHVLLSSAIVKPSSHLHTYESSVGTHFCEHKFLNFVQISAIFALKTQFSKCIFCTKKEFCQKNFHSVHLLSPSAKTNVSLVFISLQQ